jgi:hypothetical protein
MNLTRILLQLLSVLSRLDTCSLQTDLKNNDQTEGTRNGKQQRDKTNNIVRESNVRILQQSVFHFYQLLSGEHVDRESTQLVPMGCCTVCIKFCESLEDRVLVNIRLWWVFKQFYLFFIFSKHIHMIEHVMGYCSSIWRLLSIYAYMIEHTNIDWIKICHNLFSRILGIPTIFIPEFQEFLIIIKSSQWYLPVRTYAWNILVGLKKTSHSCLPLNRQLQGIIPIHMIAPLLLYFSRH